MLNFSGFVIGATVLISVGKINITLLSLLAAQQILLTLV